MLIGIAVLINIIFIWVIWFVSKKLNKRTLPILSIFGVISFIIYAFLAIYTGFLGYG